MNGENANLYDTGDDDAAASSAPTGKLTKVSGKGAAASALYDVGDDDAVGKQRTVRKKGSAAALYDFAQDTGDAGESVGGGASSRRSSGAGTALYDVGDDSVSSTAPLYTKPNKLPAKKKTIATDALYDVGDDGETSFATSSPGSAGASSSAPLYAKPNKLPAKKKTIATDALYDVGDDGETSFARSDSFKQTTIDFGSIPMQGTLRRPPKSVSANPLYDAGLDDDEGDEHGATGGVDDRAMGNDGCGNGDDAGYMGLITEDQV